MVRCRWLPFTFGLLLLGQGPSILTPLRQAPGYAEITTPGPGSSIEGIVTIRGSANHPSFTSYELSFTYADDATGTWFTIGPPSTAPVVDGALGLWDAGGVSPGVYVLRLQVFLSNGAVLESQVRDLRVGLPPAVAPTASASSPTPDRMPTATPSTFVVVPPAETSPPVRDPVGSALLIGAAMAAGGLGLFGAFVSLRHALAVWVGGLRMRRVLRGPHRPRPPQA
jgi:hypothetical protein